MDYKRKYLKYKLKYLTAKKLYGGSDDGRSLQDWMWEEGQDKYNQLLEEEIDKKGYPQDEMLKLGIDIDDTIYNFFNRSPKPKIKQLSNDLFTAIFPIFPKNNTFYQIPNTDLKSLKGEIINLITLGHIDFKEGEWVYIHK